MQYLEELRTKMARSLEETGIYKTLGIKLKELSKDKCVLFMQPKSITANLHGIIHGGIIAVILDSSIMFNIMANLPPGSNVIGIQLETKFFNPAKLEFNELKAVATPLELKRTIAMGESILYNEDDMKIAFASAIAKISLP